MGTRSLTIVKESIDPSCEDIIVMYKQFDGYPEGLGVTLASYLEDKKIVAGFIKKEVIRLVFHKDIENEKLEEIVTAINYSSSPES